MVDSRMSQNDRLNSNSFFGGFYEYCAHIRIFILSYCTYAGLSKWIRERVQSCSDWRQANDRLSSFLSTRQISTIPQVGVSQKLIGSYNKSSVSDS